jgi:hypothetical protein
MYCFDNEAFRFLAALQDGINFSEADKQSFAESWKKSAEESQLLFEHLATRRPHKIEDTLSLNNARKIVLLLCKPLGDIGKLIQDNISIIRDEQNKVVNSSKSISDLEKNKYTKQINLIPEQLGHPRTVCTDAKCTRIYSVGNVNMTDHTSHCHKHCYLSGVQTEVINNPALAECCAMKEDGNCIECSCHWSKHMHITYENRIEFIKVIDENIEKQIKEKKSYQEVKQTVIDGKKKADR